MSLDNMRNRRGAHKCQDKRQQYTLSNHWNNDSQVTTRNIICLGGHKTLCLTINLRMAACVSNFLGYQQVTTESKTINLMSGSNYSIMSWSQIICKDTRIHRKAQPFPLSIWTTKQTMFRAPLQYVPGKNICYEALCLAVGSMIHLSPGSNYQFKCQQCAVPVPGYQQVTAESITLNLLSGSNSGRNTMWQCGTRGRNIQYKTLWLAGGSMIIIYCTNTAQICVCWKW